jgi:transcription termination factor Rho
MSQSLSALLETSLEELTETARELGVDVPRHPWRDGLVTAIAHKRAKGADHYGCGILEVHTEGFGFLRSPYDDLLPGTHDIYVSQSQIRRFSLRTGDTIIGRIRPPKEQERYPALLRVERVNGESPDVEVTPFGELTATHPTERLALPPDAWLGPVDWVAPLGMGQRGLVVGPPRASRAELLQRLVRTLESTDTMEISVLLIGAQPEEVTDWRQLGVEVLATPMEELPARHLQVAEVAFERARRLAERGDDVLLLVDSLTRLLRFALAEGGSSRTIDGLDSGALQRLRQWCATGREFREDGSVTLLATLNDADPLSTALHRDLLEVANWQLTLRDGAFDRRRPDLDVAHSFSRREDLLLPAEALQRRQAWRRELSPDPRAQRDALDALFGDSTTSSP